VPVALVANSPLYVPEGMGVELILVQQGPDAADDWIAEHAQPGDVVVTADLPLAARCLEAGARVLGSSGREFDDESIGSLLATRELKEQLRGAGVATGGPPPWKRCPRRLAAPRGPATRQGSAGSRGCHGRRSTSCWSWRRPWS